MTPEMARSAARMMAIRGGQFARLIGQAWFAADGDNRRMLVQSFPALFASYYVDQCAYDYTDRTARVTDCASEGM